MRNSNDFLLWQRPYLQILSEEQRQRVYHAALEILERMGGEFFDDESVDLLGSAGARVQNKRRVRIPWSIISYVSLITLTNAINKAGTTEKEKLIAALEATDTMTPMGHMKFFKNQFGAIHQSFHEMVVFQWQKGQKVVLWPKGAVGGTLSYPFPSWEKR